MDNFKLKRVKLLDNLGLEVTYYEKVNRSDGDYWIEKKIKSTIQRHPDLDRVVSGYKVHLARIFELLAVGLYKPEADMNEQENKYYNSIIRKIDISCITFTDTDDSNNGVIIQGRKFVMDDKIAVLTTPNVLFNGEYEYISDVMTLCADMIEEVFDYVFKKKYAQLDLFADSEIR